MTETLIGTYNTRAYAEREAASLIEDAPAGVTIVLRINDDATFSLFESTTDDPADYCACGRVAIHPAHDMPSSNPFGHVVVRTD